VKARISDKRVSRFWDKNQLIAKQLSSQLRAQRPNCCRHSGPLWDLVALYSKETNWNDSEPSYVDGPVVKVEAELQNPTSKLLQSPNPKNLELFQSYLTGRTGGLRDRRPGAR
jgi:hypothetical protein